jgi:hypothetical protein
LEITGADLLFATLQVYLARDQNLLTLVCLLGLALVLNWSFMRVGPTAALGWPELTVRSSKTLLILFVSFSNSVKVVACLRRANCDEVE